MNELSCKTTKARINYAPVHLGINIALATVNSFMSVTNYSNQKTGRDLNYPHIVVTPAV